MVVFMGKSSINGPFSMAMLNNQRVHAVLVLKNLEHVSSNTAAGAVLRIASFVHVPAVQGLPGSTQSLAVRAR